MAFFKNDEKGREPIVIKHEDYERIFLKFDEYINSKTIDYELKSMKTTQWYMIDRIREMWNDIKRGK